MLPPRLIFLKSPYPSASEDKYTQYVLSQCGCEPVYIAPLTSHLVSSAVTSLRTYFSSDFLASYSGLVLTSQRSVEALSLALSSFSPSSSSSSGSSAPCPLFVVGPATGSAAAACCEAKGFRVDVLGMESGNAAALATYILDYFENTASGKKERKPLLYLAGETHDPNFATTLRRGHVPVEELVVYATSERAEFGAELKAVVDAHASHEELWLVACAPSGLAAMLKALDWVVAEDAADKEDGRDGDGDGNNSKTEEKLRYEPQQRTGNIKVAAIGPKTEQVARKRYGFAVDATAGSPTPEGVWRAIMTAGGPHSELDENGGDEESSV